MKVLRKRPQEEIEIVDIEDSLEVLQKEVGGLIQGIYPFDGPYSLICNDEGKLMHLPPNIALVNDTGVLDIIAGTILFVGLEEDHYGSLTSDDIEYIINALDTKNRLCILGKDVLPTLYCK